jgi:hypothetical protein
LASDPEKLVLDVIGDVKLFSGTIMRNLELEHDRMRLRRYLFLRCSIILATIRRADRKHAAPARTVCPCTSRFPR